MTIDTKILSLHLKKGERQYGNFKFNNVLDIILNNNILKFTVRKKQLVFKNENQLLFLILLISKLL